MTLNEKLAKLRDYGVSIAEGTKLSKELRREIVLDLETLGIKLPKPIRQEDENGPPIKFLIGNTMVSISSALITKDFNVLFEDLKNLEMN